MAATELGRKLRWAPKPWHKPNWRHPLAPGCGWIPSMGLRDLHGGACTVIGPNQPVKATTPIGEGLITGTPFVGLQSVGFANRINISTNSMTFMWAGVVERGDGARGVIMSRGHGINATGLGCNRMHWDDDPSSYGGTTGTDLGATTAYRSLVGVKRPSDIQFWYDGLTLYTNAWAGGAVNFASISGAYGWETFDSYDNSAVEGTTACCYIWPRALVPAEIAKIVADPFCFMRS